MIVPASSDPIWLETLRWASPVLVSTVVAVVVLITNSRLTMSMHRERVALDKELAKWKADSDLELARRKIDLDRKFADWQRRAEIAEETLALFYEIRAAIEWARGRAMFSGEGHSRPGRDIEPDNDLRRKKDTYYTPIERLAAIGEQLKRLQVLRLRFIAMFGESSAKPFGDLISPINKIRASAYTLLEIAAAEEGSPSQSYVALKRSIWGDDENDQFDQQLDGAMAAMNAICGPILRFEDEKA